MEESRSYYALVAVGFALIVIALIGLSGANPFVASPHVRQSAVHPRVQLAPATFASRCQTSGTGCAAAILGLINTERMQHGYAPLRLDWWQAKGGNGCIGARGHSAHMLSSGTLAHDQFPQDICGPFGTAGENIGASWQANTWDALLQLHQYMDAEPYTPGCSNDHRCNMLNPAFRTVGIGYAQGNGRTFLTEDFKG